MARSIEARIRRNKVNSLKQKLKKLNKKIVQLQIAKIKDRINKTKFAESDPEVLEIHTNKEDSTFV